MKKQTDTIKSVLRILDQSSPDECELDAIRAMLKGLIAVAPKTRGIEGLTILLADGLHRRFNPNDAKSAAAADTTLCILCKAPLKFARISGWGGKSCPGIPAGPTHAGCTAKARADVDRIFAEQSANRAQIEFDVKAAEFCACTHHSVDHERDSLDNLLKCQIKGCDCDHFRSGTAAAPHDEAGYQAANPDAAEEWIEAHPEIAIANKLSAGCDPTCAACENGEHGECDCPCSETATHVGNQAVTISRRDRVAMDNLNADIEEASARELGLSVNQFD